MQTFNFILRNSLIRVSLNRLGKSDTLGQTKLSVAKAKLWNALGLRNNTRAVATNKPTTMTGYVVFDCDIGNDDAWGLLMLIKGEKMRNCPYKILGITCVHGNSDVDNVSRNALRLLDTVDRTDIPVYKGCNRPILPDGHGGRVFEGHFHGLDGFGDLEYKDQVNEDLIKCEHAVNMMYRVVCEHPNEVDFLLVGPLTNFAMCITMYGDEFLDKVRNIYIMGGNCRGKGNITKAAEFNFMTDPEAANVVLESVKKQVVILPWETCIDGDFGITLEWRLEVLGSVQSRAMELMNRVERSIFIPKKLGHWTVCDAMLVAAYVFPRLAISQSREYHATAELTGIHTRAQMVLDHLRHKDNNSTIILEIHRENWKKIISWTAGVEGVEIE